MSGEAEKERRWEALSKEDSDAKMSDGDPRK